MSASSAEGAETAEEIREAKRLRLRENIRMIASLPTMHSTNDMLGAMAGQAYEGEYLCSALPEENFEQRLMDWEKDYYGAKSGKVLDKDKVHEATELEIENMQRLEVYETIDLAEAKSAKMEIFYTKWLDGEKPTAADPAAVRSRLVATQINNYTREDVTQATPPIKVARMVLSMAASAKDHRGRHTCLIGRPDVRVAFFHAKGSGNVVMVPAKGLAPPGVGWRALKAMYGTREASKCWGNEVTDTMLAAGCEAVMVVPMTFTHKEHGYVVECHEDDFLSCGSAEALDHLDKVLTEKFDTKVLPRIGPPEHGGQATEGPHLGRIIRWTPEGFEWESNPKHYKDLVELCGLKETSKGSDVPITKTVGKGMRKAIDELNADEASLFRQAAGTGLYLSIDRPSLQYAMSEVMGGMQTPLVKHKLMIHHVARYVARYLASAARGIMRRTPGAVQDTPGPAGRQSSTGTP